MTRTSIVRILLTTITCFSLIAACGPAPVAPVEQPTTEAVQPTSAPAEPTKAAEPTKTAEPEAPGSEFQQAPDLAKLVDAEKLPPIEERLPETPLVIQPYESTGQYGGEFRTSMIGSTPVQGDMNRIIGYENLVRWDTEWKEAVPNVAESFEVNEDGTVYTFHLRKGMKWSDGEPFTANDIMFWYEDVAMNEEISPKGMPSFMKVGGKNGVVKMLDDYTIEVEFAAPHGLFLHLMSRMDGGVMTIYPRHYAEQFHKKYNTDIDAQVKEAGVETWVDLFRAKVGDMNDTAIWSLPERPSIFAWVVSEPFTATTTEMVAKRNPYYWKVDSEGNQLPYIDSVRFYLFAGMDVMKIRALKGDLDFVRSNLEISDKPVYIDNMEDGNYRLVEYISDLSNRVTLYLNLTHPDPVKREIFTNKDFRIGLSHAINRQQLIDLIYVEQGEPYQTAPSRNSKFFNEDLAKQYTEYNVDLANEYLDKTGWTERDADGYRLGPDGKRISFVVDVRATQKDKIDVLQRYVDYFKEVGVEMQVNPIDSNLVGERERANQQDAVGNWGSSALGEQTNAKMWVPINTGAEYAVPWAYWYANNDDTQGMEPPDAIKEALQLYDQMTATADPEEQERIFREILSIAQDEFLTIGCCTVAGTYALVSNRIQNVPDPMINSNSFQSPAPYHLTTWWIKE